MFESINSSTRLYDLSWRDQEGPEVSVEAWWGKESLSSGFEYAIDLLSHDAYLELKQFMGRAVALNTRLTDGTVFSRSGLIRAVQKLGADGGFARYRIVVVPWSWLLGRGRHNRVFQEKNLTEIIDTVFADYADVAAWQWSDEVAAFLDGVRKRSYCVQYDESDYQFVARLLAEEGLGWRIEEDPDAPSGHRLTLFADSRQIPEDPVSESAHGGRGIRFHRADSQEAQDAILAFGEHRRLTSAIVSALAYDYKAKRSVAVSVPAACFPGGAHAPRLESYDDPGLYAFADSTEAERYGRLSMEAHEARHQIWLGRGTVRSLRPGTRIDLTGLPVDPKHPDTDPRFAITDVTQVGINNLSGEAIAAITQRLGQTQILGMPEDLDDTDPIRPCAAPCRIPAELLQLAAQRGYANAFTAVHSETPWRPQLADDTGARLNPRPTVYGPMSAIVVGPNGETEPNGPDELWCDALGRVKLCFHWQQAETPGDRDSCWVRVLSRQAGPGMGWQWLPRIGQEVLVDFLGGDIDRPYIMGTLYNGQGEGGVPVTPGGAPGESDTGVFDQAADHRPSGQGNLTAGNSPAWHGANGDSHRHAAALSGFKSKEFGAQGNDAGHNQLVLDDTDQQQRIQLKTTQHHSALNLGHLIHQADNYRGSFRGTGAELRTDAWGTLRAGQGLVMTTWAGSPAQPAGDAAPAMALLKQAAALADTLSQAAGTHHAVQLASSQGSMGRNKSRIDDQAAPLNALHKAASGIVDAQDETAAKSDDSGKNTAVDGQKCPNLTDPIILQAGKAGIANIAGQHLQYANGETTTFASGQDTNLAIAGKARIHGGQAIGLVAGAIRPGEGNTGLKLIAAKNDIDLQAQSDEMKLQAKKDLKLISANQQIDFAAAKKIHLAVEGGASITIDGGIIVQCPGTITVHASKNSFTGPTSLSREMNTWPKTSFNDAFVVRNPSTGEPLANSAVEITRGDGSKLKVMTDANGKTPMQKSDLLENIKIRLLD